MNAFFPPGKDRPKILGIVPIIDGRGIMAFSDKRRKKWLLYQYMAIFLRSRIEMRL